jgi:DNA-binding response OmpR family regulator
MSKENAQKAMNVLIVDDNENVSRGLGKLLEIDGYKVKIAHDGETALVMAQEFYPNAIILDLDLPGKSGYEVARTLRQGLYHKTLLIALSGYGQKEHKRMARESGFDYHLTKPVLVAEIEELLRTPKIRTG